MDKKAAKAASSIALSKDLLGTDALTVPKLFNVDGWRCIVTGGGTGLGLVTAAALAQNGATVYITGRRMNVLEEAAKSAQPASGNGKLVPIQADVSTKEGVRALRDEVKKHEKWINLLVNNHGVSLGAPKIDECEQTAEAISEHMFENEDISKWDETYRINTTSYYFTTFAFLPLLAAAKTEGGAVEPGNVVNISSISGLTPTSQRGQFNYNASKAATLLLSKMLSTEFARRGLGVRVNCICPGYFPTGMSVFPDMTEQESRKFFRERFAIPFARTGNAVDYAQTIIGVVTNQYMTGAEILIDGGWMAECAF